MQASMPVGEPSLSVQGSLPPPFHSVLLAPLLSILVIILFFLP